MLKKAILLTLLTGALCSPAFAVDSAQPQAQPASAGGHSVDVDPREAVQGIDPRRGFFFYKDPKKPVEEEKIPAFPPPGAKAPPPPEDSCKKKETWTATCGFVDPGMDIKFQDKQRDELMARMAMSKNDPKAVEAVQYYLKWVFDRASEVTEIWRYNMVQNPELDPSLSGPTSQMAVDLMTQVRSNESKELFAYLQQQAGLVYFSRIDCSFCLIGSEHAQKLSKETGLELWNIPLDDKCQVGYDAAHCVKGEQALRAATGLGVDIVPSVYIHVKPDTWLRISNGVVPIDEMKSRIVTFFIAYRKALLAGIQSAGSGKPGMDFSGETYTNGLASGVKLPTKEEAMRLLSGASR